MMRAETPAPVAHPSWTPTDRDRSFVSDNCAPAHPEVLAALVDANDGHDASYGGDWHTGRMEEIFKDHFGGGAQAYPVFNGTGANVVALQAMTDRWSAVICSADAHVHLDEGGSAEISAGIKLLPVAADHGKVSPEAVDQEAWGLDDVHRARPQVLSIAQVTELGTTYSLDELATLCEHAHRRQLRVHLDGARLANAAASLGVSLRSITTDLGVDVVSFGGTKNGMVFGDAVVVLDPTLVPNLSRARKASMQLASKMRFISAQFEALLGTDLWLSNARRANLMARRLHDAVVHLPHVQISHPVQANAVFLQLPSRSLAGLQKQYDFTIWNDATNEVRLMTSFDTTENDVDRLAESVHDHVAREAATN